MKILVLNGSPRKNGDCAALLDEMKRHIDAQWEQIDTYRAQVSPCIDCRSCMKKYGCVIEDDMQPYYEKIKEADGILLVSPLYFSTLTGSLLSFCSRFQLMFQGRRMGIAPQNGSQKWGALLLCGGGSTKDPQPAIATAKIILAEAGAKWLGAVTSLKTDDIAAKDDKTAMDKVNELAAQIRGFY